MAAPNHDRLIETLKSIYDPEIPVDVYNLGLIYDVQGGDDSKVRITMSLTSESCPSAKQIPLDIKKKLEQLDDVEECVVDVVFEPRWTAERISPEGRKLLGLDEE